MVDITLWYTNDPPSFDTQSPTQVYLLIVSKETAVEPATVPIVLTANHQGSTRRPQHIGLIVILSIVLLNSLKDSATAEWIAVLIKESSTGSCILKTILVNDRKQLGLTGGHIRMTVQIFNHRRQPVMGHLDI